MNENETETITETEKPEPCREFDSQWRHRREWRTVAALGEERAEVLHQEARWEQLTANFNRAMSAGRWLKAIDGKSVRWEFRDGGWDCIVDGETYRHDE